MSFQPIHGHTVNVAAQPLSFDLESMMKKARAFANNDQDVENYICGVLKNAAFQANPRGFLQNWDAERTLSEQFIWPDDEARSFFKANFKFN